MDTLISHTDITATTNSNAFSDVLNTIEVGTGSWNRIGKRVIPISLRIKGLIAYVSAPTSAGHNTQGTSLRMVVVHDKQPSGGSAPAFDTIFGYTESDGTEGVLYLSNIRYDNSDRFTIIRDYYRDLNPQVLAEDGTENIDSRIYMVDEYMQLKGIHSVYQSNTSVISSGAIYVYFRVALADVAHTSADFLGEARLRYYDK